MCQWRSRPNRVDRRMSTRVAAFVASKMRPVLFYDDRSPPVRSCRMLIQRLSIDAEFKFIDLFSGAHLEPEFVKINPIHTVPVLQHGNLTLTDSHAILIYLCEKFGRDTDLYPADETLRIKVINRLFFESSILFRRDSEMLSDVFRGELKQMERHKEKVREAFSMMEVFLGEHKFMACDHVTLADLSMITTLSTVAMVVPLDKSKWPRLAEWYEEMKSFPGYDDINVPGRRELKKAFAKYCNFELNE